MSDGDSSARYVLLDRLADEVAARLRRGERPTLAEYAAKYPELADDLADLIGPLLRLEQVKADADASAERTPPAASADESLPGGGRMGDYLLVRLIGRGGMGAVYEAEQLSLGRRVALKVLPAAVVADPASRARFEREAKAAGRLHHTNIVPVFGVGQYEGTPFYAMQFIEGQGLDAVIREVAALGREPSPRPAPAANDATTVVTPAAAAGSGTQTLSWPGATASGTDAYWRNVALVGAQAADALAYAHAMGVVHRDIKPGNLLLDAFGKVWVTDFGLAKASGLDDLTGTGEILGTLRYLPPEAFAGATGPRSDVHALGLTLFELAALRPAYDAADRAGLVRQAMEGRVPPLRAVRRDTPRDLATIVAKATERDAAARYATAAEFADDLRRFAAGEPVRARPLGASERVMRWVRREPVISSLVGAIVLGLAAFGVFSALTTQRLRTLVGERDGALTDLGIELKARLAEEAARTAQYRTALYARDTADIGDALRRYDVDAAGRLLLTFDAGVRGWEADVLERRAARMAVTAGGLTRQVGEMVVKMQVNHLAVSPDGSVLAGGVEAEVRLWDARTLRQIGTLRGHGRQVLVVGFTPDGRRLFSTGDDQTLRLWDARSGRQLWWVAGDRRGRIRACMDDDGRRVYACDGDTIRGWDVETGEEVFSFLPGRNTDWLAVVSGRLFAFQNDTPALVIDIDRRKEVSRLEYRAYLRRESFTRDGRRLAGAWDGLVRVLDVATGKQLAAWPGSADQYPGPLVWSPDGKRLVGSFQGAVKVWDVGSGREELSLPGHGPLGISHVFSRDGATVFASGANGQLRAWNLRQLGLADELRGHVNRIGCLAFSPDGATLLSTDYSGNVRTWDVGSRRPLLALKAHGAARPLDPIGVPMRPDWPPNNSRVSQFSTGAKKRWDSTGSAVFGSFDAGGRRFACGAFAKTAYVRDVATGKIVAELKGHDMPVFQALFAPDGSRLATASAYPGTVHLRTPDGGHVRTVAFPRQILRISWDADGRLLTRVWGEGHRPPTVQVHDPEDGRLVSERPAASVEADSPDGKLRATGDGPALTVTETATGKARFTLRGHPDRVGAVAFSPDGRRIVSGCDDGELRVWDVATGLLVLTIPEAHVGPISALAFSPDGRVLATGGDDNVVRLWDGGREGR